MLVDDGSMTDMKVARLRSEIVDAENTKTQMKVKIDKLEAQKSRLEDIFKATMKGGTMDLIDQVQLMVRRIDYLEEQSMQRSKNNYMELQEPYIREIEMLKSKLVQERDLKD